jgi:hypothetical protein
MGVSLDRKRKRVFFLSDRQGKKEKPRGFFATSNLIRIITKK